MKAIGQKGKERTVRKVGAKDLALGFSGAHSQKGKKFSYLIP